MSIVQIPLWSMNTVTANLFDHYSREVQIPLWSMNTPSGRRLSPIPKRSDSSMVDEYAKCSVSEPNWSIVQIPLWSMNTPLVYHGCLSCRMFRFLYGR